MVRSHTHTHTHIVADLLILYRYVNNIHLYGRIESSAGTERKVEGQLRRYFVTRVEFLTQKQRVERVKN